MVVATLNTVAMSEDNDWFAFPAIFLSRRDVALMLLYDYADWWMDDHPAVYVDDDDCTRGWVTAYRELISRIERGHVRLAGPDDDFDTYHDEWWVECEADHPDAEPAWVVRL
jgi:hypothetical protein